MTAPNNKPLSKENLDRFKAYRTLHQGWGNLNLVLGDQKIKNQDVTACRLRCEERNDQEGALLADVLMGLSKSQRIKLSTQVM